MYSGQKQARQRYWRILKIVISKRTGDRTSAVTETRISVKNNLKAFFSNYVLMTAIIAWLVAQILKIFTGVYRDRRVNLSVLLFF